MYTCTHEYIEHWDNRTWDRRNIGPRHTTMHTQYKRHDKITEQKQNRARRRESKW